MGYDSCGVLHDSPSPRVFSVPAAERVAVLACAVLPPAVCKACVCF